MLLTLMSNNWMFSTQRSGWWRMWLSAVQEKANAEYDGRKVGTAITLRKDAEVPRTAKVEDKVQGSVVVPLMLKSAKKKNRAKQDSTRKSSDNSQQEEVSRIPDTLIPLPRLRPRLFDQPLPDYSISVFQKARDFQHHQQHLKQKRQREEETLILLLAA